MRKHQELSLEQIIEQVRVDQLVSDDFCLYGKEDGELKLDCLYWVSDYPDVVDDSDVYPADASEQDLQLVYYGEQLIDVLAVALEEKPDASLQDLVEALNYYNQHDSFMPFDSDQLSQIYEVPLPINVFIRSEIAHEINPDVKIWLEFLNET